MRKSQNTGKRNMKRQGSMASQMVNNHTTKDLMSSEGNETSISKSKIMMKRMIMEMKKYVQK
jgi:hypothetical protein